MNPVGYIILACVISTILFAALIIYISKHPQKRTARIKMAFVIMFVLGTLTYCACHYMSLDKLDWVKESRASWYYTLPYVIMRSVIDVGMMFYGHGNSSLFYSLDVSKNPVYVLLFWLLNVIAFYTAASALLVRFGGDLLRWIRRMTTKLSDVDIIFGVNQDSLAFGRNISGAKGTMLVYVDSIIPEDYEASIREIGGLTYSSNNAVNAAKPFLQEIRVKPRKTRLRLFALSGEYDRNLQYARNMSASLKEAGILPEQTELVILGTDEWKGMFFQSGKERYGYGSVISFDEHEMSARLLMHKYPMCNAINFDADGRATENMNVLIVGFGRLGHEVLRKVIANGQFEGSRLKATIYDPNFTRREGFIKSQYPLMFSSKNYDVEFEPQDGRGGEIFEFLKENASKLKYIVICIEDRYIARDIAVHMVDRLQTMGYPLNVYTCDSKSVRCYSHSARECDTHWIYDSNLLYSGEIDQYAMELNHRYCGGKSGLEDWKNCGYFDRMSSRACVDYLIPLSRRITGNTGLTSAQRENLAKSEHARWCAFHWTFGFDVMGKEEFAQRVRDRDEEIREHGKSSIKTTKDKDRKLHVCLVDWDGLDEVSRIENSITHGNKDYKDLDRKNVDTVMELTGVKANSML